MFFFSLVRDWATKFVQSVGFGETKSFLLQPCGCMAIVWLERNHPGSKFTPFTIIGPKIVVNGNPKAPRTFPHFYVCLPSFLYKNHPVNKLTRNTHSLGVETLIPYVYIYIFICIYIYIDEILPTRFSRKSSFHRWESEIFQSKVVIDRVNNWGTWLDLGRCEHMVSWPTKDGEVFGVICAHYRKKIK